MKPKDYIGIAVWHRRSGSFQYYIDERQAEAADEGAPADAIYRNHDTRKWVCVSDLAPEHEFRMVYAEAIKDKK